MLLITREIRAREAITAFDAFLFVAANFIVALIQPKDCLIFVCLLELCRTIFGCLVVYSLP